MPLKFMSAVGMLALREFVGGDRLLDHADRECLCGSVESWGSRLLLSSV